MKLKIIDFLQNEMGATNIRFPETSGIGVKPVSKEGTERLVRAAIQYAIDNNRKTVTLVHKGNIMKFTEGAFKQWGYDVAHNEFLIRYLLGNNMMKLLKKMVKMQQIKLKKKANKMEKSLLKILSLTFSYNKF